MEEPVLLKRAVFYATAGLILGAISQRSHGPYMFLKSGSRCLKKVSQTRGRQRRISEISEKAAEDHLQDAIRWCFRLLLSIIVAIILVWFWFHKLKLFDVATLICRL